MAHPWFGTERVGPTANAERIRETLRTEIRDTGWPYQSILPATPITVPRSAYAELFRAANTLLDLLRRTVLEIAPTTQGRLAAYRATERDYPLFLDDQVLEERYAHCMTRPDVVIGPNGPRFVEFNVGGGFGGPVEVHCRYRAWQQLYGTATGKLPFFYHDPLASRADFFHRVCEDLALPPRVALVGSIRDHIVRTEATRYFDLEVDYLRERGFTSRYFEPEDLEAAWHGPPELRYPVGLRHLNTYDWQDNGISLEPVRQAIEHGCLLLATQTAGFIANKLTMGLLSEGRPWLSAAERSIVDTYLPWTRILGDRSTTHAGQTVDLLPHALRHRENLVLKRGIGTNGKQVVLGRDTEQRQWQSLLEGAASAGDSIVQEYVPAQSCRLHIIADSDESPHEVEVYPVLGPFLFGGRPGGIMARFTTDCAGMVGVTGNGSSDSSVVAV
jgi:hypothetical protein